MKRQFQLFDFVLAVVFVVLTITFIYPFWQLIVTSFATEKQVTSADLMLYPKEWTLDAYRTVFRSSAVLVAYRNTILRTVLGTTISVLVTFAGAYSLSKPSLPLGKLMIKMITVTMFFSGGLIPTYLLVSGLGLRNSFWVLILPCMTSAMNVILTRNFLYMLPPDLEESAEIDGAGVFKTLVLVVMPLSMPIIAVLMLYSAVAHWNAWFDAYIYLSGDKNVVLQLLLRRILFEIELTNSTYFDTIAQNKMPPSATVTAATIVITIGPIIAVYPFVQKYFVKGIMLGAIKG